ncbi:MAG: hypothetical protein IPJ61_00285 [Tessaracoccus sp.]|uniref:hypothetical protein n=1 Tax=Tessaracoccus sp. TaxID=1971211 RepID=UPI001EBC1DC1|nr:hypothetical protein [Tessaracoccus sp.]MBK7819535.1 hypothetical protein [Tessaracoccus sp.]
MTNDASTPSAGSAINTPAIRKGVSIAGLVLAFLMPPVGLVVSVGVFIWAKRSGERGGLSLAGIVLAAVMLITMVIVGFWIFTQLVDAANAGALDLQSLCVHRDRWGWLLDSLRYACR